MTEPLVPLALPCLGEEEAEAARRVILSGWIAQGPEVAAFEREFAALVGASRACAVSSGTAALHLALTAAGIGAGDEVITASHSFIATANAIRHCGAVPVFADIQPGTFNLDPACVDAAVTPRTRAILCVHQMGMPCDLAALVELGRRRRLLVLEDAACAAGSEILWQGRWEPLGRPHADAAGFSFHPRKVITTGEGGMITTSREDWDDSLRLLRHQGMRPADSPDPKLASESYPVVGYNCRMTDVQAAIGRVQLGRLQALVAQRRVLARRYAEMLADLPRLMLPEEPGWARSNWQSYCIRLEPGLAQRAVMKSLLESGVAVRRGIVCAHREKPYAALPHAPLPHSERASDETILLPLFAQMGSGDQERVVAALRRACS